MTRQNGPNGGKGKPPRGGAPPTGRGPGGRAALTRRGGARDPETPGAAAPPGRAAKGDAGPGREPFRRRAKGFLHAAAMTRAPVDAAFGKRGFAEARVLLEWREIAGEALCEVCRPVKVSYAAKGFGATLVVLADGARAPEVEMLAPRILERVNACYGYRAVARVRVTQTSRQGGFADASQEFERRAAGRARTDAAAALTPEDAERIAETVAPVGDSDLRAALERLGRNVRARARRDAGEGGGSGGAV